jgi:hypothetical protein
MAEPTVPAPKPAKPGFSWPDFFLGVIAIVVALALAYEAYRHVRWVDPKPPAPTPAPTPTPKPAPPGPTPTPTPNPSPNPPWFGANDKVDPVLFGWSPDAPERHAVAATMVRFRAMAPGLMKRDFTDQRPILLYKAWTDVFARPPPYPAQQIGDCVSFGHAHANDLLQCIEWILSRGESGARPTPADIQETDTEALYAMAREAGGMLGTQDGCFGSAAVKAMTTMGVVSRRQLGTVGVYDGRRAKKWGRTGAPASVKTLAAPQKLGAAANVSTWDELVAALHNGNVVTICTGQGFTLTRDAQGFCMPKGTWGHCMFIAGVRFDRPGGCIIQSWGPDMPTGPLDLDQPDFSFWADQAVIEKILAEGDSWALSKSPRFGAPATKGHRKMPSSWRRAA